MKSLKILFYFTHKESLGHTTRVLSILHALKRIYGRRVKIFVFQAGKEQDFLKIPKQITWLNLPHPYYSKLNFKKGSSHFFVPLYAKLRAKFMISTINQFKPDIFITEFFPFGREDSRFELLPILAFLKKRDVKIYASIGYPYIVRSNIPILLNHCDFYNKFFIHTPRGLEYDYLLRDIKNPILKHMYRVTFNHIRGKVLYTGYILPFNHMQLRSIKQIKKDLNMANNKILVLVSRGGGVRYPKIIASAILAKKYLSDNFIFVVTAGPASSKREISLFKEIIFKNKLKNILFLKYLKNFPSLLQASDLSISMSGYNTSVQLLYYHKHCILVPSQEDPETAAGYCSEQISRAKMLKDYLGSEVLDYYALTPEKLADAISSINLNATFVSKKKIEEDWFKGAEITANGIVNG